MQCFSPSPPDILVYDSSSSVSPVPDSLQFDSHFESGNLKFAYQTAAKVYTLILEPDTGSQDFTQWYYFSATNKEPQLVNFKIVNFVKENSLYSEGMKPLVRSKRREISGGETWVREGTNISYVRSTEIRKKVGESGEVQYFYVLSFTYEFEFWYDTVYFAYSYPYTYSDLVRYLSSLSSRSDLVTVSQLCCTASGTPVPRVTITSNTCPSHPKHRDTCPCTPHKKVVFMTGRVHPGETVSSVIIQGAIDFLLGSSAAAKGLLSSFIFEIIPMLNPEGVKCGHYRCSPEGVDLNRVWNRPSKTTSLVIWHVKELISRIKDTREVVFFVDIHGHSRKKNAFLYGCDAFPVIHPTDRRRNLITKAVPLLLQSLEPCFSFNSCTFLVTKDKETTARVVCHRELNILLSYTLESSFFSSRKSSNEQISQEDYLRIGANLCQSLLPLRQEKSFLKLIQSANEVLGRRRGMEEQCASLTKSCSALTIPVEVCWNSGEGGGGQWSLEGTVALGKDAWEQIMRKHEISGEEELTGDNEKEARKETTRRSFRKTTKLIPTRLAHILESTPKPQPPFRISLRPHLPKTPKVPIRLTTIELSNEESSAAQLGLKDTRHKQDLVSKSAVLKTSEGEQGSSPALKKAPTVLPEIQGTTIPKALKLAIRGLNSDESRSKSTRPDVRNYWDLLLDRERIDPLGYLSHTQEGLVSAPPIRDYNALLPGIAALRVTERPIDLAKLMAETTRLRIRRELTRRVK